MIEQLDRRASKPTGLAFVLAALAIGGGGAAMFAGAKALRGPTFTVSANQPSAPSALETAPDVRDVRDGVEERTNDEVQIEVVPPNATIYWDDKKQAKNPASFPYVPDKKVHRIRAEAPGYASKTQIVSIDGPNTEISLELQPLPISMGPISATGAGLDADAAIERMRDEFRACYTDALVEAPTLAGKATILMQLGEGGRVDAVDITDKEGLNAQVTTCLATKAETLELHGSGRGSVKIPLAFRNK